MTTHRALCIGDVLDLIFQELKDDKPALAACALTCQFLLPIALDYLWKELETSMPIKRLLPNLWNADGTYRAIVRPDEWERFDKYAVRVEVLGVDELDTRERYRWQIYCQDYEQADRAASLLLFPLSLRELRVDFGPAMFNRSLRVAEGYLQAAARQVPRLEHLRLHGDPPATSYMCITQYKHLHILDLRYSHTVDAQVYRDLISAVSTMRELVELHLPDQGMNGIRGNCVPPCRGFQTLQVLGIQASPNNTIQFLDTLATSGLREVVCKGGNIRSTPSEWREYVQKLCAHHGASLHSVDLRSRAVHVWDTNIGNRQGIFKDITAPLLGLHQLEDVTLEFFMVDLSAEDLYAMASAWPNLRHLEIRSKIDHYGRPADGLSTYNCLLALAQLCPKLVHLELIFQDDKLPDIAQWPLLSHGLRELKLDIPLHINAQLAPFLERIFPKKYEPWIR